MLKNLQLVNKYLQHKHYVEDLSQIAEMDETDKKLLRLVQQDCDQTHEQLSEKLHISNSSVRRKLDKLRKNKVIKKSVALIEPPEGMVTIITSVRLMVENNQTYASFKSKMSQSHAVTQCYNVSGEADFIVIAHFSKISDYDVWISKYVLNDENVQRCETNVVYSTVKFETAIPI